MRGAVQETEGGVLLVEALLRCMRPQKGRAASELEIRSATSRMPRTTTPDVCIPPPSGLRL